MNTPTKTQYLLLFLDTPTPHAPAPEEMQVIMGKWMTWLKGLKDEGIYVGGNRLEDGKKVVRGVKFTDGPYVESKEIIGGYIVVNAASMAEAEKVAKGCPGLEYGGSVEVRPMYPPSL
jgi:hypothetical protein